MTAVDPQPGDWVLIRAKVIERPFAETVLVELFSKTDQYSAHVRPDLCVQIVARPVPDEPGPGSVALLGGIAYQLRSGVWRRAGSKKGLTWAQLHALDEVEVIHHG